MSTIPLREVLVTIRLTHKLNPSRFPHMTPLMAAIVGHLLDLRVGNPSIVEIVVTSDGFVLARVEGEVGANHFIGNYGDLLRNWFTLLDFAGLTPMEQLEAEALFAAKVGYFGRTTA
jgi:hypothetical protein